MPDDAQTHSNLAVLLATNPERQQEAIMHYEAAVRLRPDLADAHRNLANLLAT